MAYVGQSYVLPLGENGLLTDLPEIKIPPSSLSKAFNISFQTGGITKDVGTTKFNPTALDSGSAIVGVHDWWPDGSNQRTIAITASGKVFRDTGNGTFSAGVPIDTSYGITTNSLMFVEGGNETAAKNKKLFIFTNSRALGYIDGDATTITNVTPATDWAAGNYPTGGFIFKDRLIAYGNPNFPHQLYISPFLDHSDFSSSPTTLSVFPGEFDRIIAATVYKGVALIFKYPMGVYVLNSQNSGVVSNWTIDRIGSDFGLASPNAVAQVLDDLLAANSVGSINSLQASDSLGSLKSGDILANAEIEDYIRDNYDKSGVSSSHAIYYDEKKLAYFTLRSKGSLINDAMLVVDVNKQNPRYSIDSRNSPNCLGLRRDDNGIPRPFYGASDGHVYLMEASINSVDGKAYTGELQTPDLDFSFLDASLGQKNKIFDFISVSLVGRTDKGITCDVFLDGYLNQTIVFNQVSGALLDSFLLDTDSLSELSPVVIRKRVRGAGKRIKLRFYTSGVDTFELQNVIIDFRLGDEGATRS